MKINKRIMNPERIRQLYILQDVGGQANANVIAFRSGKKREQIELSIERFVELGLASYSIGGSVEITEAGVAYLTQLASQGTIIPKPIITDYERDKTEKARVLMQDLSEGEIVSTSMFQRRLRVGYGMATAIQQTLLQEGRIEAYDQWLGTEIDGVKTDGNWIKCFRIPKKD